MSKLALYWEFYKSTLVVNWIFSIAISLILLPTFFTTLSISVMTGGPLLSLLYKEISSKNEFYFYYNQGVSKVRLVISCMILNILVGLILIKIFKWLALLK